MFRSGDCEGQGKTFSLGLWRYSVVDFEVCFGSSSYCRTHPLFNFNFFTDGVMFASRICWYLFQSMLPLTNEMCPVPLAATQPQSMIDPHLCFRVGEVFFSWNLAPFFLQTYLCTLWPKSSILISSVHRTCFQNASGLFRCSFANFRCWILWLGHRKGFLLMTLPWRSYLFRCRCIVEQCTTTPGSAKSFWRSFAVKQGFLFAFLAIQRAVLSESFLHLPDLTLISTVSVNCHFLTLRSEETATWKHFATFL